MGGFVTVAISLRRRGRNGSTLWLPAVGEAERWLKQGIALAEQIKDPIYIVVLHIYLALTYQDQGKWAEARTCILRALTLGRAIHNVPYIGFALVALGGLHTAQAAKLSNVHIVDKKNGNVRQEVKQGSTDNQYRFLRRAKVILERALALEELEVETKTEGQLALAHVLLLLGELNTAQQYVARALEEARQYELTGTRARCQRLLGSILTAQGKQAQAEQEFEQAIEVFQLSRMRVEYGRTLHCYGVSLLQGKSAAKMNHQQGWDCLYEAGQIFRECHATLDLKKVEDILAAHKPA